MVERKHGGEERRPTASHERRQPGQRTVGQRGGSTCLVAFDCFISSFVTEAGAGSPRQPVRAISTVCAVAGEGGIIKGGCFSLRSSPLPRGPGVVSDRE